MKRIISLIVVILLSMPAIVLAQKKVNEYGEDTEMSPDMVVTSSPAPVKKSKAIEERAIDSNATIRPKKEAVKKETPKKEVAVAPKAKTKVVAEPVEAPKSKSKFKEELDAAIHPTKYSPDAQGRAKRFRVGLIGPGIAAINNDVGALMTIGAEAEYFIFERLSAGIKADVLTKFENWTILSFVPQARYVFDFDRYPRWSIYVQAGVGVAMALHNGGTTTSCDIAIPGGGFWWQWTDHLSAGADASMHIYARSGTNVGVTFAPAIRYLF